MILKVLPTITLIMQLDVKSSPVDSSQAFDLHLLKLFLLWKQKEINYTRKQQNKYNYILKKHTLFKNKSWSERQVLFPIRIKGS